MADPIPALHEFGWWHWIELRITVGEIVLAASTLFAAYWITRFIQKRQANDEATRDLLIRLCEDALRELGDLSAAIEECGSPKIEDAARLRIRRQVQRFSNSVHTIEIAVTKAELGKLEHRISDVKDRRHELQTLITEPLMVADSGFEAEQRRQIEGEVRKTRETLITLQLDAIKL